ncbi:hypothetical protein EIB96_20050 [Vibrio parahaemolyticus]|nr:hypothetical protein DA442_04165 [Vibrio parahaemolyticus]EGQ8128582.1 hypothetical protein [Vibrio parahaemolyticus]EGQ8163884.1 hypothetical protein [Vibrio parahaemolyticus]EGQ8281022.1 hypothetical protein [Vibrio parahaemolyticus]EGQ8517274.1 hypothetical protein [Vibrio parahaemolyticus]
MNVFQRCTSLRKKSDNKKRCHWQRFFVFG